MRTGQCVYEPTSAPGPELAGEVLNVLWTLAEENMTMGVFTHETGVDAGRAVFVDHDAIADDGSSDEVLHANGGYACSSFCKPLESGTSNRCVR